MADLSLLVFGASGQLATELRRRAGPGLAISALARDQADLADPARCAEIVAGTAADVVVNAAAYTAVDRAEEEAALAHRVNAEAPGAIAAAAAARDLPFLHVSTDYVFDGSGDAPRREDAPTGPLGVYGQSKLAGEQAVTAAGGPHVILRVSWVFSAHGGNFVKTMLRVGAARDRLTVVDDQIGGPTAAADIAGALIAIARAFRAGRGSSGVYHFAGAPAVSWRGFADEIFARAGWPSRPEVAPIRTEDWPTQAARPRNSRLDCGKIARDYGIAQPDWRVALDRVLTELKEASS